MKKTYLSLAEIIYTLRNQGADDSFIRFVEQDISKHGDLYERLSTMETKQRKQNED